MEEVRASVTSILDIDDDILRKLLDKLIELGVKSLADVTDVQLEDIIITREHPDGVLLPIPARRLIRMWNQSAVPERTGTVVPSLSPTTLSNASTPVRPLSALNTDSNWHKNFYIDACVCGMLGKDEPLATQEAAMNLRDGVKLTSCARNEVVHCVADYVVKHSRKPHRSQINVVAEAMVNKYEQLKDDIDGFCLGSGYMSIRNQLENRIAYLNRPLSAKKRSGCPRREAVQDENEPFIKKKLRDGYGCVDFLPIDLPDGESADTSHEKKQQLKLMYSEQKWNASEVTQLMAATYTVQRQDLVGVHPLSVTDIKLEWPFLLEVKWFVQHLARLLGVNILEKMETSLTAKKESLLSFFGMKATGAKLLKKRMDSMDMNVEPVIAMIPLVMAYFHEKEEILFRAYEVRIGCPLQCTISK